MQGGEYFQMDINSAEKNIQKLLAYVKDLADTKPKMYQKSRGRLKDLAETCNEVISLISIVLQEEVLSSDDVEFGSQTNLAPTFGNMQAEINNLCNFAGIGQNTMNSDSNKEVQSVSSKSKKKALQTYRETLQKLSLMDFRYVLIERCAKLLWHWFDTRFVKTVSNPGFKYNMKRFPIWIRDIVVLYGKAVRDNTCELFEFGFNRWLESLSDPDDKNSRYAIPYDVFCFEKSMQPSDMSLEAVILWDILMDCGLSSLCNSAIGEYYLREDSVYDLCSKLNPEILNDYVNYSDHPEIFGKIGWEVLNG